MIITRNQDRMNKLKQEKIDLYEAISELKPNIFTYSMLFKTMHIDFKKNKNPSETNLFIT
jgi:hypothetical protein